MLYKLIMFDEGFKSNSSSDTSKGEYFSFIFVKVFCDNVT